jgi:hypothetical protein
MFGTSKSATINGTGRFLIAILNHRMRMLDRRMERSPVNGIQMLHILKSLAMPDLRTDTRDSSNQYSNETSSSYAPL